MTTAIRLPVAPRAFRDELLSSWMARVAACHGLDVPEMTAYLAGQGGNTPDLRQIDDMNPDPVLLGLWAEACRIDPARLWRRSLASRHPDRPRDWFLEGGTPAVPACLACFYADFAAERDGYMRADWRLAERVVCSVHCELLRDRCPVCGGLLRIAFRTRHGRLRPFCCQCDALLADRGGGTAARTDLEFAAGIRALQQQAEGLVRGGMDHRMRLEDSIRTLWAPLDHVGAARPILALWLDQPGWHCPYEARAAVGKPEPFQSLPVRWRALTLVALHDLFGRGLVPDPAAPEAGLTLFRRAAPVPWHGQGRAARDSKGKTAIAGAAGRVRRLSKSPVHRLTGNFAGERGDFGRIHP